MIRSLLLAVIVATLAQSSAGGTVVLFDGDFDEGNYETSFPAVNGFFSPDNRNAVGIRVPISGNPGAIRRVSSFAQNFGNVTEFVFAWHINTAQTYDPAEGAIQSIDYLEDSLRFSGTGSQEVRLAVRQDGILYRSKDGFLSNTDTTQFATNVLEDLTSDSFEGFFAGDFFPLATPDFSIGGSELEFGFLRISSNFNGVSDSYGVDNWTVTLTTQVIPEPNSLMLVAGVTLVGLCRRRK